MLKRISTIPHPRDTLIFYFFFTWTQKWAKPCKVSPKIFAHPQKYFSSTFSERGGRDESKNVKKFEIGPQMRCVEAKTCFDPFLGKMTLCHVGEIDEARLFQQSRLFIPAMGPQWKLLPPEKKFLIRIWNWVCTRPFLTFFGKSPKNVPSPW